MKILHYTVGYAPAWKLGGPPRSISALCEGLVQEGHEVQVLTTNAGLEGDARLPLGDLVVRNGVGVRYFPSGHSSHGIISSELELAVQQQISSCDVLHITGVWQPTSRAACRAARTNGKPYLCSPRGALSKYSFAQKWWKKWPYYLFIERSILGHAAAIHCTSGLEQAEWTKLGLKPKSFVVPNSINPAVWQRDEAGARRWREQNGIPAGAYVFLFAGRFHHKKGLDLMGAVCARLKKERDWRFVMVGYDEDGTGESLRRQFMRCGLRDRIMVFQGVEAHLLPSVYSAANIFVFPSRHENFGNVVLEALACGCPVVMSDKVGVADQLADNEGIVVLPRDIASWSETLNELMAREVRVDWRNLAERFSMRSTAARMAEAYRLAVAGSFGREKSGLVVSL